MFVPEMTAETSFALTHADGAYSEESGDPGVVVRVVKAKLFRSFEKFGGKMDPFAVVSLERLGGKEAGGKGIDSIVLGQTQIAKGAHMEPEWNHMCRPTCYHEDDQLHIEVSESNWGRPSTFCGQVTVHLRDLLVGGSSPTAPGLEATELQDLPLQKKGEQTGQVTVQLLFCKVVHEPSCCDEPVRAPTCDSSKGVSSPRPKVMTKLFSKVDASAFVTPVKRLGVSGGTACFFDLRLKDPPEGVSVTHWIGKDLSHALDEIWFYEELLEIREKGGSSGVEAMIDFTFEYLGVLEVEEEGAEADGKKQLLVLRNLRDGREQIRMLDIKMGEHTAAAGWQGKSRFAAMRQNVIDGLTNSSAEGFRLEGFDGMPPVLESFDPLLDFRIHDLGADMRKKAGRLMLQRMSASEAVMHFSDLHQVPKDVKVGELEDHLSATEYADILLSETARQLAFLAAACRRVPVPQKWVGSSVALCFDAGTLPRRSDSEEDIRSRVVVNIFDWGRSELNTIEKNSGLSAGEQADRLTFWRCYVGGVDRLAWETARAHYQRFRNAAGWREVVLDVYDFDSATENDFIGQARLQLPQSPGTVKTLPLKRLGHPVSGAKGPSSINVKVDWRAYPEGSRLKGAWRVTLLRGSHLPGLDKLQGLSTSDPCTLVQAVSEDGTFHFCQQSTVVKANVDPVWNETFELSVPSELADDPLHLYLGSHSPVDGLADEQELFPPSARWGGSDQGDDDAFLRWSRAVTSGRRKSFGLASERTAARRQSAASSVKKLGESFLESLSSNMEKLAHGGKPTPGGYKEL